MSPRIAPLMLALLLTAWVSPSSPAFAQGGVEVEITPELADNFPGGVAHFTVSIKNLLATPDNFELSVEDNLGWGLKLSKTKVELEPGEVKEVTLSVTIPDNALPSTQDNVVVSATAEDNADVRDNAWCIAHVILVKLSVSIWPKLRTGPPGETVGYLVEVKNEGTAPDNYIMEVEDNLGWAPELSHLVVKDVMPGEEALVGLNITIPEDAVAGTIEGIKVTALSALTAGLYEASDNCLLRVEEVWGVEAEVLPQRENVGPGTSTSFSVVVWNRGSVEDNYSLEVIDAQGWRISIFPRRLTIKPHENGSATLTVRAPVGAAHSTEDNILVTVRSETDNTIVSSVSCVAQVVVALKPRVWVSPEVQKGLVGTSLSYDVLVVNEGNVADEFSLTAEDQAGWELSLTPSTFTLPAGENRVVILSVNIPLTARPYRRNFITVRAASTKDPEVIATATCIAWATSPVVIENEDVAAQFELSIPSIKAGERATENLEGVGITKITIEVRKDVAGVKILIQRLVKEGPAGLAALPPGKVYGWFNLMAENIEPADLVKAELTFAVEKSWVEKESIDPATIAAYRYDLLVENWRPLPTERVGENQTHLFYSATSGSLSVFAVSGEVKLAPPPLWMLALAVGVALVVGGAIARRRPRR